MADMLAQELKAYREHLESLLGSHEGQFVLIYGSDLLGTFDNQLDAVRQGYRELGNVPFLVKRIERVETPLSIVSNLLGL